MITAGLLLAIAGDRIRVLSSFDLMGSRSLQAEKNACG